MKATRQGFAGGHGRNGFDLSKCKHVSLFTGDDQRNSAARAVPTPRLLDVLFHRAPRATGRSALPADVMTARAVLDTALNETRHAVRAVLVLPLLLSLGVDH